MPHVPLLDRDALRDHFRPGGEWAIECGRRVRKLRKERGYTLEALAELIDSTAATVSRVELGAALPSDQLRAAIGYALVTDVAELWPEVDRKRLRSLAAA